MSSRFCGVIFHVLLLLVTKMVWSCSLPACPPLSSSLSLSPSFHSSLENSSIAVAFRVPRTGRIIVMWYPASASTISSSHAPVVRMRLVRLVEQLKESTTSNKTYVTVILCWHRQHSLWVLPCWDTALERLPYNWLFMRPRILCVLA